jgi:hypothetical protein
VRGEGNSVKEGGERMVACQDVVQQEVEGVDKIKEAEIARTVGRDNSCVVSLQERGKEGGKQEEPGRRRTTHLSSPSFTRSTPSSSAASIS